MKYFLLATIATATLLDGILTTSLLTLPEMEEFNPLMRMSMQLPAGMWLLKTFTVAIIATKIQQISSQALALVAFAMCGVCVWNGLLMI